MSGWRRAYRQIRIEPPYRKWSAVALKDPSSGKVAFFVMFGRSVWCRVYNYTRLSAASTDILRRVFIVATLNFYYDKYGFEPEVTATGAFALSEKVHYGG